MHSIHFLFVCCCRRLHHVSIEWWLTWKNSHVWLVLLAFLFFEIQRVAFFSVYLPSFSLELTLHYFCSTFFFLNIVHKTMPCRHASKPWHGDGSVTSPYIYTLLTINVWIYLCLCVCIVFFFANTYIPLLLFVTFLALFFSSFFVYLFSILLMFSNTTLARHAIRL